MGRGRRRAMRGRGRGVGARVRRHPRRRAATSGASERAVRRRARQRRWRRMRPKRSTRRGIGEWALVPPDLLGARDLGEPCPRRVVQHVCVALTAVERVVREVGAGWCRRASVPVSQGGGIRRV